MEDKNPKAFVTTRWSVVLNAADESAPRRQEALEQLCQDYWHPLYWYTLRRGFNSHDAQDLIQGFFQRLLEKNYLKSVDREKGKFRSFLIVALKRFIQNEFDKKNAIKRGGAVSHVSLDFDEADLLYGQLEDKSHSADEIYDRGFALTIINKVLAQLEKEYAKKGKAALFPFLRSRLPGQTASLSYEEAVKRFDIRLNSLKSEVHRFRQKFRDRMLEAVANLVSDQSEIKEELRYLLEILQKE